MERNRIRLKGMNVCPTREEGEHTTLANGSGQSNYARFMPGCLQCSTMRRGLTGHNFHLRSWDVVFEPLTQVLMPRTWQWLLPQHMAGVVVSSSCKCSSI